MTSAWWILGKARVWSSEPIVVQGELTSLGRDEIADANLHRVSFPGSALRRLITPPWSRSV